MSKIQEYTGVECKKESSVEVGDVGDKGEEEDKDGDNIFFWVKQENLHIPEGVHGGIIIFCTCSRRWREG